MADQYWVMRESMTNRCRVQVSTAAPIGARFKGPFATREAARQAMCELVDADASDTDKCWSIYPVNACDPHAPLTDADE